ncbi:FGGY family carbohydrate kinase [Micromonospora sp. NBRC 101691]|uniref:xylulokinase n=1 Tax=Micromonospora sp. NBRC 101691 TaxID=3032198 RepID=UPI00249FA31D|nr:FGGY family carbohydrate kinase [Micromonospora sp. NBRC 101691]GLY20338.1 pentose kinase [Micromonospora sp. NBRC 101691]
MSDVVLAVDLGTGGCKAALVDPAARVVATTFAAYPTTYPAPGRHEQRPADWWAAVVRSSRELLAADAGRHRVVAVGLSGHSLAMVPVDADGTPLLDTVPIWSDTRGEDAAAAYFADADETGWYARTGNGFPRGMYTVFKAAWLRAAHPDVAARTTRILGSKDWVNARLTGVQRTDPSYASGSGAYDLTTRRMLPDVLAALGLPADWWPPVVPSTGVVGRLTPDAATATGLPAGVPVVAGGVDNSCMALGAGLDRPGEAYLSLGSSNWVTVAGAEPVLDPVGRPYVFDHVLPGLYVSALSTFGGGSSLTWLAALLGREDDLDSLFDEAAAVPVGADGLTCVPTLAGGTVAEGGPAVRGAYLGLDLGHTHGHLARALVEGIGFSLADAARTMLAVAPADREISATGGGARGALMLQVLADLLGRPVSRPDDAQHGAALGAAALALLGTGTWTDTAPLRSARRAALRVDPRPDLAAAYAAPRARFDAARAATRAHAAVTAADHDDRTPNQE